MSERWGVSYRPNKFGEVVGQEHVVAFFNTVLGNYFNDRTALPVGFLFGGHSGVGKTTIARVVAASLNCEHRDGIEPCGECETCASITGGTGGGVLEIDASFFGLVDNIRSLRDRLSSYSFAKYQVVILDECHMLSREASNVLLKLLEEPPENVLFIMCTTEVGKMLDTVRSRLVEFRFSLIPAKQVVGYIQTVLQQEKVTCSDELVYRLYKLSDQNLRDVLVSLEQLALLGHSEITQEQIAEVYGDVYVYDKIVNALRKGDFVESMKEYQKYMVRQPDFKQLVEGLVIHIGEKLHEAILSGTPDSAWYAYALKTLYEFLSNRMTEYKGAAAVRLLFFRMLPEKASSELVNVDAAVRSVPTVVMGDDDIFKALTSNE